MLRNPVRMGDMRVAETLQPVVPKGFKEVVYQHEWQVSVPGRKLWDWLNSVSTFRDNQVWPFQVEFLDPEAGPGEDPRFAQGVYTNHQGPFLNAAGMIGEIRDLEYRDLQYFYGSYVLCFKLVRPTRLQFWYSETDKTLKMSFAVYTKPWFKVIWLKSMEWFWERFGRWFTESVIAEEAQVQVQESTDEKNVKSSAK